MYHVDVLAIKGTGFSQDWSYPNSTLLLCDLSASEDRVFRTLERLHSSYSMVVGVDYGIVAAAKYAEKFAIPLAFISYEIFFADEIGLERKTDEINACKNVAFAVSQDVIRAYLTSREYGIPSESIIRMPVSDELNVHASKSNLLRGHFRIGADARIALYAGAVSEERAMVEELLAEVPNWPSDWVLVLHSNRGFTGEQRSYFAREYDTSRVYFSDLSIEGAERLAEMTSSADLGIAFFKCNFSNRYTGKNILFIGLSQESSQCT